jgi:membrane fusion protein, multidrug efflux system
VRMTLIALISMVLLAACAEEAPPVRQVNVIVDQARMEPYRPQSRYVGRLQAEEDVTISAQVSGYLLTRNFDEGALVQAGDVLYTIDASEYEAGLAKAKASLAAAVANQANAERNYSRGLELLPKQAISQSEMDSLTAKKLDTDAGIASAQAQVTSAQVSLDFTTISAPISGRIGRSRVSPGDLVGPTTGELTTLVSIDPIQALFQVSEATYIAAISERMANNRDPEALRNIEVSLEMTNGQLYPEVGKIDYFANRIDTSTGTLEARALIPNPHSLLVPGQYVRVVLQDTNLLEGLFIPQAAVQADQQGAFALIVDNNNTVARRNVELGHRLDANVLVIKGIAEGEQVIVRGLQQVRPGMVVTTTSLARDDA